VCNANYRFAIFAIIVIISKHTFRVHECAPMPFLTGYQPTLDVYLYSYVYILFLHCLSLCGNASYMYSIIPLTNCEKLVRNGNHVAHGRRTTSNHSLPFPSTFLYSHLAPVRPHLNSTPVLGLASRKLGLGTFYPALHIASFATFLSNNPARILHCPHRN
jgi:hypothetical protein